MTCKNVTLQRRHFELIAGILRQAQKIRAQDGETEFIAYDAADLHQAFASELAATNGLFDREHFLDACQGEG